MVEAYLKARAVKRFEVFVLPVASLLLNFPPAAAVLTAHLVFRVLKSEVM